MDRIVRSEEASHLETNSSLSGNEEPAQDLIQLRDVSVRFRPRRGIFSRKVEPFVAVDHVDLSVKRGQTLGLVGETGSGKSTIAKVIMGMVQPTSGSIVVAGHEQRADIRRLVQVVMQDPYSSLDPRMRVGDIIAEPLTLGRRAGASDKTKVRERVAELLELVGLPQNAVDRYPNQFSGGQRQRIATARALAPGPDLIVLDEPTSALDASVKAQILNLLVGLQEELGVSYLIISHDLATVAYLASEVAIMLRGRIIEYGPTMTLYTSPRHPFTLELLESAGGTGGSVLSLPLPTGVLPESLPPTACRFAYRCALRTWLGDPDRCLNEEPPLADVGEDHRSACHFPQDVAAIARDDAPG